MQIINWFDSESDLPEISTILSTPNLSVNVGQISVPDQILMAIGNEDDSVAGLVFNRSNRADDALSGETEPDTRGEFLTTSSPTTPQSKPTSSLSRHCSRGIGRDRGIRREEEKCTIIWILNCRV